MTIIKHEFTKTRKKGSPSDSEKKKIPVYTFRIEISFSSPPITRTITVPGYYTLGMLNRILQLCFSWSGNESHRFMVGKICYGPQTGDKSIGIYNENEIELYELESSMGFIFSYLYDAGAGWECEITLEESVPDSSTTSFPKLVDGQGAAPPEELDDIHHYQNILAQLESSTDSPEAILSSYGLSGSHTPDYCDIKKINEQINTIFAK